MSLKNKFLLLKTKLFIFFWTRRLTPALVIKRLVEFYRSHILGFYCEATSHMWPLPKVEWSGSAVRKHRTCSRCSKRQEYKSIFSTELKK